MKSISSSDQEKSARYLYGTPAGIIRVTLLMLAAAAFVMWYYPTYYTPRPVAGNTHLGPAVTFAFGEGFKNPTVPPTSKLGGFLNHSTPESLSYDDVDHPIPGTEMSSFQWHHCYLIGLIGLCWRLFGVSWIALGPLLAVMAAVSVASVYGILRSAVRPSIAWFGALALLACPAQLALLHYSRDYSKTPIFFAVFYLLTVLLCRPLGTKGLLLMGGALGLLTGFGYGIRQDVYVIWGILPIVYLFFLPTGILQKPVARFASLSLAAVLFLIISRPAMSARETLGNTTAHHLIMGLFRYNHDTMGLGGAPYVWLNEEVMTDNYVNTIVQDHNRQLVGKRVVVDSLGVEYDRAGKAFVKNIATHFPADFLTRVLAASSTTVRDSPWLIVGASPAMYDVSDPFIQYLQNAQAKLRNFWNAYGVLFVFVSLTIISWRSLRLALAATGLIFFFTGYTALQFQPRHFWHLGVVAICVSAFLLEELLRIVTIVLRGKDSIKKACASLSDRAGIQRVAAYIAIVVLGTAGVVGSARLYQTKIVTALFDTYRAAAVVPAASTVLEKTGEDTQVLHVMHGAKAGEGDIRDRYDYEYIAVRFEGSGALPDSITPLNQNSGPIEVQKMAPRSRAPATVYFPMYEGAGKFDIRIKGGDPAAKISVASIPNPDAFPNPMVLVLPDDSTSISTHNSLITPKRAR